MQCLPFFLFFLFFLPSFSSFPLSTQVYFLIFICQLWICYQAKERSVQWRRVWELGNLDLSLGRGSTKLRNVQQVSFSSASKWQGCPGWSLRSLEAFKESSMLNAIKSAPKSSNTSAATFGWKTELELGQAQLKPEIFYCNSHGLQPQ